MSTIKKSSNSSSGSRSRSASKTSSTKPNNQTKGPEKNREARQTEKKDGFKASQELKDSKKPEDAKKPGEEKDGKKSEEGKDKDALLQKLSDLQKQLDEMKNKKQEKPENLGGCCGGSKKAEKPEDAQKQDPDSELTQLAVAVMQGGNNPQMMGQQQPGKPGQVQGINGLNGAKKGPNGLPQGNPAQLRQLLSQKYQQYKTQGVQLRKETEQLVEAALAGGQPMPGQQPGMPNLGNSGFQNNQQARPLAKAS